MHIVVDLDQDFENKLQELKKQYSYDYMKISGLKPQQMSFSTYIKDFVEANNANDYSVDGTSNSDKKDVVALLSDINKPMLKLTVSFNKIYTKIKEKYGKVEADKWLESEYVGKSYLHDAHMASLIPYCYAYDLKRLANEGLFFLSSTTKVEHDENDNYVYSNEPYNSEPAQHLDSFINLVKEFVSWTCNRQSGAVGLPNIIVYLYYFWIKDIENHYNGCYYQKDNKGDNLIGIEEYPLISNQNPNIRYFKQQVQALIYALNQPFLRGGIQSAFTNFSIFDHEYAHALFDGVEFPDGTLAYDHIDNIVTTQKIVMDVISEIRHKQMFTFPVLSYSLLTEDVYVWSDANNNKLCVYSAVFDEQDDLRNDVNFNYSLFNDRNYAENAKSYCIKNNLIKFTKFKDEEFARWASDHNCEWMDSNFFMDESVTSLSNCCRLKSDIKDIGYFNSIGGTALSVGSVKVNTINLARIMYEILSDNNISENIKSVDDYIDNVEKEYINKLTAQVNLNLECLDVIRNIIKDNATKRKLLPNISKGLIEMKNMYNTVGFIGIYELLRALQNKINSLYELLGNINNCDKDIVKIDSFGNTYYTKRAEDLVKHIFENMQQTFDVFKEKHSIDYPINCEQIPGESAAEKLMKKDYISYPEYAITDLPLYGNQFLPLGIKATIEERVRVAALFDRFCSGGSIAHLNFDTNFSDKEVAWGWLIWLAQQKLTYSAFTTKINACIHNHAFFSSKCPICYDSVFTRYSRIVGFYTSVDTNWSTKRKEEFLRRQWE